MPKYYPAIRHYPPLKHYVSARIVILPEDEQVPDLKTQPRVLRTNGDIIQGYVEVTVYGALELHTSITFTGVSRTWIASSTDASDTHLAPVTTAEHKFLVEKSAPQPPPIRSPGPLATHTHPFHFALPATHLISPHDDVPRSSLALPPSARLGALHLRSGDGAAHMQPLIAYAVSATVRTAPVGGTSSSLAGAHVVRREVDVLPTTRGVAPPLEVGDYAGEYRTRARAGVCARGRGAAAARLTATTTTTTTKVAAVVEARAREPARGLDVSSAAPRAATELLVAVRVAGRVERGPRDWGCCEVATAVRARTFYAVARMAANATVGEAAARRSGVGLSVEEVGREVRVLSGLVWRRDRCDSAAGEAEGEEEGKEGSGAWSTVLRVPVSASKALMPTFATEMAARRYSVVVRVRLKGFRHGRLELEVPVQVTRECFRGDQECGVLGGEEQEVDDVVSEIAGLDVDETDEQLVAKLPPAYCETE